MTRYHYEALTHETFQKLAQALITHLHPDAQCLPIGQPDGGRDALVRAESDAASVVFQVKYSRAPQLKDERRFIQDLIATEKPKLPALIARGTTRYYLLTNVLGTGHLDVGSIDIAHAQLTVDLGITAHIWWRDDLDARLDNAPDIKWAYPQILNAADVLSLQLQRAGAPADQQAARTVRAYLSAQCEADREVKFKQIDLNRALAALFVDLPMARKRDPEDANQTRPSAALGMDKNLSAYLRRWERRQVGADSHYTPAALAAAFFLQMPRAAGVARFVVEGAPGQGKSTVTQFVCQIHRLRLLNHTPELQAIDEVHKSGPLRTPFRIDLRDYEKWLAGTHPFALHGEESVPVEGRRSLERFIAMQVRWYAGNLAISEHHLLDLLSRTDAVLVLDGFDEVADVTMRARLVAEISAAATRLHPNVRSLQIIITSRPAVFANSPGFPEDDWIHFELRDLRDPHIRAYGEKWIRAQQLRPWEAEDVTTTLEAKLDQPHLRDLARNPMQLSILLHLIHVQGVALPEKRTTLYDDYMSIFFNREAQKSDIVRERRELMLGLHGMLAWELQAQAEDGSGGGSLTTEQLAAHTRDFLAREEHDVALADVLLAGSVERVGALVSRVQGAFEFEVQPLREYFAARHLYITSPYSPAGRPQSGTRPERFDALARNRYWTNVTRFFCGFYDVGELGTLMDGLLRLSEEEDYDLVSRPRELALMLLADHVFSQSPREVKRLMAFVTEESGFGRLVAPWVRRQQLRLSDPAGRALLFAACERHFEGARDRSARRMFAEVMAGNGTPEELMKRWRRGRGSVATEQDMDEAFDLGVLAQFESSEIWSLTRDDLGLRASWLLLAGRLADIGGDRALYSAACSEFFAEQAGFSERDVGVVDALAPLHVLTDLLDADRLALVLAGGDDGGGDDGDGDCGKEDVVDVVDVVSMGNWTEYEEVLARCRQAAQTDYERALAEFASFVCDHLQTDVSQWRAEVAPWTAIVDRGLELVPDGALFESIAAIAAGVRAGEDGGEWGEDGFDRRRGLVARVYWAARRAGDLEWWRVHLGGENAALCCGVFLASAEAGVVQALSREVVARVEGLGGRQWARLGTIYRRVGRVLEGRRERVGEKWFDGCAGMGPRTALAMIGRVGDPEARRRLARRLFADYEGGDWTVLRGVANWENVDGNWGDADWELLSELSRRARSGGVDAIMSVRLRDVSGLRVAEDVARSVLRNSDAHCRQFITLCEQSYSGAVGRRADSVSWVAARDEWFVGDQG